MSKTQEIPRLHFEQLERIDERIPFVGTGPQPYFEKIGFALSDATGAWAKIGLTEVELHEGNPSIPQATFRLVDLFFDGADRQPLVSEKLELPFGEKLIIGRAIGNAHGLKTPELSYVSERHIEICLRKRAGLVAMHILDKNSTNGSRLLTDIERRVEPRAGAVWPSSIFPEKKQKPFDQAFPKAGALFSPHERRIPRQLQRQ